MWQCAKSERELIIKDVSRIFFVYKKIFFCDVTKHETSSTHPSTLNHYNTYNKYSVSDHNIRKLKPGFRGNFRPLLSSMMVYNILKKIKHTLFLHLMHAFYVYSSIESKWFGSMTHLFHNISNPKRNKHEALYILCMQYENTLWVYYNKKKI